MVLNIPSCMSGVDLWQSEEEHGDEFGPQSSHDGRVEVVGYCGSWHMAKMQVRRGGGRVEGIMDGGEARVC